jgi:CubicO group peptidase (beta-lactamase class C family)
VNTLAFAKQYLFTPLGIGDRNWQVDKQGYHNGGAGLKITPHDMVKIGQLILNRGEYNGKRIISQQWIDETISSKISTNNSMAFGPNYGFCWWTGSNQKGNYVFANGWGGQFIVVVPSMKLVVVATNQWSGVTSSVANDQWYKTMDLILSRVLTAFS